jgi:hypothetical protein
MIYVPIVDLVFYRNVSSKGTDNGHAEALQTASTRFRNAEMAASSSMHTACAIR